MTFLSGKTAAIAGKYLEEPWRAWTRRSAAQRAISLLVWAALGVLSLASAAGVASSWFPSLETFGDLQGHFAAGAAALIVAGLIGQSRARITAAVLLLLANFGVIEYRVDAVDTCAAQMAATGTHVVRVMTLNVLDTNRDYSAVERAVAQNRPDILVMEEIRPHHRVLLGRLRAAYPHQAVCLSEPDCGIAIVSKFPLKAEHVIGGQTLAALQTTAVIGNRDLTVLGAHLGRPFGGRYQLGQFRLLTGAVEALPANSVVVGDFNSTLWSSNMARYARTSGVCASNLAHATWPQWLGPLGVPIDHIFLKHGVGLLGLDTVSGTGSDHRGIVATLSIR